MSTSEKGGKKSRGEFLPEDHPAARYPEITHYGYLLDWLQELGPCRDGALIGWADFKAWTEISGYNPKGWEIDLLRQLSSLFVHKVHEFRDSNKISPYLEAYPDENVMAEWQKEISKAEKVRD